MTIIRPYHQHQPFNVRMLMATINNNIESASRRLRIERKDSAEMSVTNEEETNKRKTTTTKKKKKFVSFYPTAMLIDTIHHKDYTRIERFRTWYMKRDLIQMKIEYLEEENTLTTTTTTEGEDYQQQRSLDRKRMRKVSRRVVIEEQEKQMQEKIKNGHSPYLIHNDDDDEKIVSRYIVYSKYCAFEAYNRGLAAEVEAFGCEDKPDYADAFVDRQHRQQQQQSNNSFSSLFRKRGEKIFGDYFLACAS